ncbi:MAG TPA: hypothetical protein VGM01_15715 [Ktedonobacteraceae bacterium]
MDGFSHDGFHPAVGGWNSEQKQRQGAGQRVAATGSSSRRVPAPPARLDRWVERVSGQYSTSVSRKSQSHGRQGQSLLTGLARPAHWNG